MVRKKASRRAERERVALPQNRAPVEEATALAIKRDLALSCIAR